MYLHKDGLARLITSKDDKEIVTGRKESGARAAAARGLVEYLRQLHFEGAGGRQVAFKVVEATFGDLWTPGDGQYPAANVHGGAGDADYDSGRSSGGAPIGKVELALSDQQEPAAPLHRFAIFSPSTFEGTFAMEVWASDKKLRDMLEHLLEDDLNPCPDWLAGGVRLELPYYCGARADYHVASGSISYDGTEARRGCFKARYQVEVNLDLRVLKQLPRILPRFKQSVQGVSPDPVPPAEPIPE